MDIINYYDKQVLIIEDLAQMRASLKSMLDSFGARYLDTAVSGDDGINKLRTKSYDLVLCDYDLGKGKDGQQVLEECRHGGLLNAQSVFILVTAAQTVEMVMGALEYEPDGYIAKPITLENLRTRVGRILRNKSVYEDIDKQIDERNYDQAIENCNKLITKKPKFALPTYRIKGNLLLKEKRFDEALELYKTVLEIRELGWAQLGFAKSYFFKEQYDDAVPLLTELTESSQRFVEAWDWLAKIWEIKGDKLKAQQMLQAAVERSPKAVLRQAELSRIATDNEDWSVAAQASRKAVSLGKHSCYKDAATYIALASALQEQIKNGGMRDKTYASNEAIKALENVRKDFEDSEHVQVKSSVIEGVTYNNLGKPNVAHQHFEKARDKFLTAAGSLGKGLALDIINGFLAVDDEDSATEFQQEPMVSELLSDQDGEGIKEAVNQKMVEAKIAKIDNYNNRGVELFEQGKVRQAVEMFQIAAEEPLANESVLLNTIQALLSDIQTHKKDTNNDKKEACGEYIERLSSMPEDDQRFPRLQKLRQMYSDLR